MKFENHWLNGAMQGQVWEAGGWTVLRWPKSQTQDAHPLLDLPEAPFLNRQILFTFPFSLLYSPLHLECQNIVTIFSYNPKF